MNNIAVIGNLPSGGARAVFDNNHQFLKYKYRLKVYKRPKSLSKVHGIFEYYLEIILDIIYNYKISKSINQSCSLLLAYQSWLTKSPLIFPFIRIPIIYICNEVPREHHDTKLRSTFNFKERFINDIVLYPVKLLDLANIKMARDSLSIITLSKLSKELIYNAYKITPKVIYPSINSDGYGAYRELQTRKNQIVSVGAINKYKNQLYILKAIAEVEKKFRPKVILVGNGCDEKYCDTLRKFARNNEIELSIKLNISRKLLINIYKESLAFLYAPISEPFGLVVFEAMRAGLPLIVSSDGGGYLDLINHKNGYILKNKASNWAQSYESLVRDWKKWEKYSKYNYNVSSTTKYNSSAYLISEYIQKKI